MSTHRPYLQHVGTWTMIYDEGFEVRVNDHKVPKPTFAVQRNENNP